MERKHVLWVDDDQDDLELMQSVLECSGHDFRVKEARNGKEALDYLTRLGKNEKFPCLIVLDMNMPVMDGREALKKIKENNILKDIPIVVFTTSTSLLDQLYCIKYDTEMITKPVTYDHLKKLVQRLFSYCRVADKH